MAPIALRLFEAAAVGVIGMGAGAGAVKRCMECPWTRLGWGACGGFGEGCLTRQEPEDKEPGARSQEKPGA